MSDSITGLLAMALAALVLGFSLGGLSAKDSIILDCEKLGQFRVGEAVYTCSPKGKG